MITFRFNKKTKKKSRSAAVKKLEKLSGVFRIVNTKKEGFAELNRGAVPEHVAQEMNDIKNIRDVEIFDFS